MLLLATIKDKAVDHSLLRKLDLLPIRSRRRERMSCDDGWLATDDLDAVEPSDVTYKVGVIALVQRSLHLARLRGTVLTQKRR